MRELGEQERHVGAVLLVLLEVVEEVFLLGARVFRAQENVVQLAVLVGEEFGQEGEAVVEAGGGG